MSKVKCFIDDFSGSAVYLPKGKRTPEYVLAALRTDPRVSVWDMSETPWLRRCIASLEASGAIMDERKEPFPWIKYTLTQESGE